uniref:HAD family phosphatase n=1 Tax=Angiostrongylus costaricensis TaxID=334426 RepID=A0A0R3PAM4_ANGCS
LSAKPLELRAAGYITVLLTNNFYADRARCLPTIPEGFGNHFDLVAESCRLGMRKPDVDIYQHVCQKMKVTPAECVFLDDLEPNVVAAKELGFITVKVGADLDILNLFLE